jgi:ketosteroid isomerase-like protein
MRAVLSCALAITFLASCNRDNPRAGQTTETSRDTAGVREEIVRLQHEYLENARTRDSAAAGRLLAGDAIIQNPDGSVQTGAQNMKDLLSGMATYDSLSADSLQVQVLGPGVALVSGRARVRGRAKMPGGKTQEFSGWYRFMDVWQKRREGQWQVVAEQVTRIGA